MNADILQFFEPHMDALPIYEALENAVWRDIQPVEVRVQKTQISFYNRRMLSHLFQKGHTSKWCHSLVQE